MEKLTAREKVAVWALLFLIRYMLPKHEMADDMKKMVESIQHQVNCNL